MTHATFSDVSWSGCFLVGLFGSRAVSALFRLFLPGGMYQALPCRVACDGDKGGSDDCKEIVTGRVVKYHSVNTGRAVRGARPVAARLL